jgi:hypothetical protein
MRTTHVAPEEYHEPGRYEIRLKGHLDARWAERFAGLSLTHGSDGTTSSLAQSSIRPRCMAC